MNEEYVMNDENNNVPHIAVNAQYVKDLSFENPAAPSGLNTGKNAPKIDLSLDLNINRLPEDNYFEVELNIQAKATNDETIMFVVDLKYAGIFHLININEEQQQMVLAVHCPAMIFPFARKIIASVTQDGGFQPLMIDPIDFATLYHKKMSENNN